METRLADWLALARRQTSSPAKIIDADISTVTGAADKVLRVEERHPWLLHLELQSSREGDLAQRIYWYNALLEYRHKLPVHSMVVLLRSEADAANLTGENVNQLPGETPYRFFKFQVVKIWQMPLDQILRCGVGMLPLAPLCDEAEGKIPIVIEELKVRFAKVVPPEEVGTLWTATDILMGLRYPREFVAHVMKGVNEMKDSDTYQAILEEGMEKGRIKWKLEGKKEILFRLGKARIGPAPLNVVKAIESITDPEVLDKCCENVLIVGNWQKLLDAIE